MSSSQMPFARAALLAGGLLLFHTSVRAQDANQILQQAAAAYRNLQSYEFQCSVRNTDGKVVSVQQFTVSGLRPGKFRVEEDDPQGLLRVADGTNDWTLSRSSDEFVKAPLTSDTLSPVSELETLDQHVLQAEIAREELFVANGNPVRVFVVRVTRDRWPSGTPAGAQMAMYRIDETTFRVYRVNVYSADSTQIRVFSIRKWNQSVSDSAFVFTPPPTAHMVSKLAVRPLPSHSIIGTEAPDFTLPDSHGQNVHLKDLLGKTVVVDFWASWCGPCRASMPDLHQLYREFSGRGLVVLGVNVGEEASEVDQVAAKEAFTFPLLHGAEPDVSIEYFVDALPTTIVVDRQGRISYRAGGYEPPKKLRSAVVAALNH